MPKQKVFITANGDIESRDSKINEKDPDSVLKKIHKGIKDINKKELPNVINAVKESKKTVTTIHETVNDILGKKDKKKGIHTFESMNNIELITTAGLAIVVIALILEYSKK